MVLRRDYKSWPEDWRGGVLAIGNFDGVHLGHQAVIRQLVAQAKQLKTRAVVLTFEPHPRRLFNPQGEILRLMPFAQKAQLLFELGVDIILAQRFTRAFAQLKAEAFVQEILIEALGARQVMTGEDFVFGQGRGGDAALLAEMAKRTGAFDYIPVAPVSNRADGKFSSSKIRDHLKKAEIVQAAAILGQPYRWLRLVVQGDARGRELGYPTANMVPPPVILPKFGIYAVRGVWEGKRYDGVANLGIRPMFRSEKPLLEVHWFDFADDLYGKKLQVEFVDYLREERKFDTLEALKAQMAIDCEQARRRLSCAGAA